jgi:hypothetical protein
MRKMAYVLSIPLLFAFSSCSQRTTTGADRSAVYVPTAAAPGVIPAGTTIAVRTNERIDTEQPVQGRTYEAQVTRAIVGSQNDVLVPEGSMAQLRVVRLEQPGTVGTGELSLALLQPASSRRCKSGRRQSANAAAARRLERPWERPGAPQRRC